MNKFTIAKIGTIIELTETEQQICKFVANLRFTNARKNGIKNSKIGNQSNEFTDLQGFSAEFAFCKLFNLFPDFTIYTRSAIKDELDYDAIIKNKRIDIKATKYNNGRLIVAPWKDKNKIDIFVLMIGTFPKYKYVGCMTSNELIQSNRIGDLGHGKGYMALQYELKELEYLI